ncbi:MAG: heme-binding protein [Alphaproteobacteria bacterium]|nr:heme-binding protein [Alphaproteobacteria bacterium]
MRRKHMWLVIAGVFAVGAAAWGPIVSNVEQAKYEVVESHGDIEIRDYAPMIVAEAEVSGERKEAINQGFRIIADYIFGNNAPQQKVAMTAPVIQQSSEKIAMTAPVIQQGDGSSWKVRFVMPASYTMDTLPKPNNDAVKLKEIPGKRFAVIRFSGIGDNENLKEHEEKLGAFIEEKRLEPVSVATYAFFNPPWTLPFLRRNEVMVEVAK